MKILFFLLILSSCFFYSQTGNVGINTSSPSATLDIVSKDSTATTKALKISNSSSTEMLTVLNNGQVGVNQSLPSQSALLELNSANSSLLLTRVASVSSITTPSNGMIVYDISQNCVRAYENGIWSSCLSSGGGPGPDPSSHEDWGLGFTSTVKDYEFNGVSVAALVTTDGKVFFWGFNNVLTIGSNVNYHTPVYVPLPSGEIADTVSIWGAGLIAHTISNNVYIMNLSYGPIVAPSGVWSKLTIPGESAFTKFKSPPYWRGPSTGSCYVLGQSGKLYRLGGGITTTDIANTFTEVKLPAGVTSYTDMWVGFIGKYLFLKGNDKHIYALGVNNLTQLGIGNNTSIPLNLTPQKVLFPDDKEIVSISLAAGFQHSTLALASDGTAYAFGLWRAGNFNIYYGINQPDPSDIFVNPNGSLSVKKPYPIPLPSNGDTKFTNVYALDYGSIIQTDVSTYFKGRNNGIVSLRANTYNDEYIDLDPNKYNVKSVGLHHFKSLKIYSDQYTQTLGIPENDKLYYWGYLLPYSLMGVGYSATLTTINRPTAITTGIGDPNNPNPLY